MLPSIGTDTYGKVKAVDGTPVVTKFATIQSVPVYPLESYYYFGATKETYGPPLFAFAETVNVDGVPLSHVDWLSAAMAYIRGFFGILVTLGFVFCFFGFVDSICGGQVNAAGSLIIKACRIALLIGLTGGLATYAIPTIVARERQIRTYSKELLGSGIDPAKVRPDVAQILFRHGETSGSEFGDSSDRSNALHDLIAYRVAISQGDEVAKNELQTDIVLDRLRQLDEAERNATTLGSKPPGNSRR